MDEDNNGKGFEIGTLANMRPQPPLTNASGWIDGPSDSFAGAAPLPQNTAFIYNGNGNAQFLTPQTPQFANAAPQPAPAPYVPFDGRGSSNYSSYPIAPGFAQQGQPAPQMPQQMQPQQMQPQMPQQMQPQQMQPQMPAQDRKAIHSYSPHHNRLQASRLTCNMRSKLRQIA